MFGKKATLVPELREIFKSFPEDFYSMMNLLLETKRLCCDCLALILPLDWGLTCHLLVDGISTNPD